MSSTVITCEHARIWLREHYNVPQIMALRFYGGSSSGRLSTTEFDPAFDEEVFSHVKACDQCENWVTSFCGENIMHRQRRLAKYCCAQLFSAVEEPPAANNMTIHLEYHAPPNCEGSHYWKLTVADNHKKCGSLMINYCPFCGRPVRVADSQ